MNYNQAFRSGDAFLIFIDMKLAVLFVGISLFIGGFAQKKNFTIEECELAYSKGLYPKRIGNLMWLPSAQSYAFSKGDSLEITNLKEKKSYVSFSGDERFKRVPATNWLTDNTFYYYAKNEIKLFDTKTREVSNLLTYAESAQNTDYNEAKNLLAYTIDNNLFVASKDKDGLVVFKSDDKNIVSGQAIHRFEFGISKGTFWSPQGNYLAFYQKDETDVADYPLLDINTTPGSLSSIKYPMAGQKSEYAKVGVYNVSSGKTSFLVIDMTEKDHFLTNLAWTPDEKHILLAEVNRDQNHFKVNMYNVESGRFEMTLFEESMKEWAEPEHAAYFIPNTNNEFLWLSERNGFMNIYHYNIEGKLMAQVTNFKWVVHDILGFSMDGKKVYFEGTGEDPRENHCFEVDLNTKVVKQLTQNEGTHHVQLSSDRKYLIDTWSNWKTPRKVDLVDIAKAKVISNIQTAADPLKDYNMAQVDYLKLKSEDGFDLYARMMKPHDFDPSKKYPVLVYVYGGPHAQLVTNEWLGGARLWMHYMTQQGYIVFTVDGRGSANRGYDFEKVIHRQLGTNEMKDQLIGVDYLKSLPYVDADRMAVHGWSFGGFMTTSLMLRNPGVFTCGVAGGPVIDWKWYEVMYGERYMDRPEQNVEGYKTSSLLNYVENLEGDLLMIHGTVDDVVVMQHNLAFVQACVSAGVQIDFFPYPMHQHNVYGKDRVHLMTKILNYIIEKNN